MQKRKLEKLCNETLEAMRTLKYSKRSLYADKQAFSKLISFASARNEDFFSQHLIDMFLEEQFSYHPGNRPGEMPYQIAEVIRSMKHLSKYASVGYIEKKASPKEMHEWSMDDYGILCKYISQKEKFDFTANTIRTLKHRLQKFYECLKSVGMSTSLTVNKDVLNVFWASMQGDSARYCQNKIYCLGDYLRYLHREGYLQHDLSGLLPKVRTPSRTKLPAIWTKQDVEKLLSCIDINYPVGKRDYAIFAMVAELGLRASDIINLKLENLKWDTNTIEITQRKTGKLNVMPMTSVIGWALIDYLKHGRPSSDEPYVFLRGKAPYSQLTSDALGKTLTLYRRRCGLFIGHSAIVPGMHSFRHSLAHRLLEKDVPLDIISEVMGHTHFTSTSPYLKIDINGLRSCALSLEEVKQYASHNL